MILKCDCHHPGQDRLHGEHNRVHNQFRDKAGEIRYRCTVCLKERPGRHTRKTTI